MATLAYTIEVEGLSDDALVVTKFDGQESLSASMFGQRPCYGFCYQVELASRQPNLTPEQVVDRAVELRMYRNRVLVQRVHGVARAFTQGDIGHHHTFYSLTLVPALERLSLRHNSRIFQHQTTPDIIATLLQEMGINDYAFSLERELAQREFCVQYRESDLDFLHRLAAEEGMVYSFIHEAGKHTLVFSDSSALLPSLAEPVPYNGQAGGVSDVPYIKDFRYQSEAQVAEVELKDYSFKKPAYSFSQSAQGAELDYQQPIYSHFDAPGRYKDDQSGTAFTRTRLSYLRRDAQLADGKSNEFLIRAGYKFTLSDHLNRAFNRDWLLVRVSHHGEQPQALEEESGQGATTYKNQWQAIPGHINWQAAPETKPTVDGPMIATVVGPEGEEIFCDEHGRVKVHFHWDRDENAPEHRSCWVRVSQGWAGNQYGMMAIPRIGHEVIVSFLNGDPDQPIITGRTYHATNTPPYSLPDNKTKTVLRSETHQGEGFNELSFEDQADQELVYLHAQKNMQVEVKNSADTRINYDHVVSIGHNEQRTIAQDRSLKIEGKQQHTTVGDYVSKVEGDEHNAVLGDWAKKVAGAVGINADGDVTIKSGNKITLQVGGSFVVIDSSGVAIDGAKILIKSGGSPGSVPMPSSPDILETAAAEGSAFVANCPAS
ncbi:type VI secretion system tip protein VgrG [Vibrio brasiliensis]|uniref:type VI secretion system Vgr family protein n=1 Tax=Vibrio brasiliensis TaxID=170652 RepID=UPI001EFC96F4|nr:type VI secretion system tip protein VgrG [Vibrio brasiliensis]MCG9753196.1 type VI secretion system tip protein VgrG [Vibrio brasiliensis]